MEIDLTFYELDKILWAMEQSNVDTDEPELYDRLLDIYEEMEKRGDE